MHFIDRELLLLLSALTLLGLIVGLPDTGVLRQLLAIPLVFFIPGHMILRLFRSYIATGVEGAVYAFGASVSIVMAGGFLLHSFALMTPLAWAVLLCSVTGIAWVAQARRRRGGPTVRLQDFTIRGSIRVQQVLMFACAALLATSAYFIDRHAALAHAEFKYTQFWLISQDPGNPNSLTLGIENGEGEAMSYRIEYMVDGQIAGSWKRIDLQSGKTWTTVLNTGFKPGRIQRVEAWLFKSQDRSTEYRRVWADIGHP